MGCITSSDKSEASYHPEENFERGFWSSLKKNYKVKQTNEVPMTPTTQSLEDVSKEVLEEETSDGYHSETISTANTSNISFDPSDCDLKMEMYMMTKISRVMPKTSSPILPRYAPAVNYNIPDEETEPRSYRKWKQNLQLTPPYVLTNIARIPEAIAGQFTPEGFPMYTDVMRCKGKTQKSLRPLVRM